MSLTDSAESSVEELEARFTSIVAPIAEEYNLTVHAFGKSGRTFQNEARYGNLVLSDAYGSGLNPAPITPTTGSKTWDFLSSVILYTFQTNQRTSQSQEENKYVVAPQLNLGR